MKSNIERYETIIINALEILQKQKEINELMRELSTEMSVRELVKREFDRESADKALAILKTKLEFIDCQYVKKTLKYKDLEIHLHEKEPAGYKFIEKVLSEIKTSDVSGA